MLVVALNFRGTPEMTLHKYWARVSAECCRRRIEHGTARYDFLRLLHISDSAVCCSYGRVGARGSLVQPVMPAMASEAPISCRKPRRENESSHSEAPLG